MSAVKSLSGHHDRALDLGRASRTDFEAQIVCIREMGSGKNLDVLQGVQGWPRSCGNRQLVIGYTDVDVP